jgi:pimeloyl-ACP methyl ester carboxylesterase
VSARPEPFRISVSQPVLDDLAGRLARTRFAPDHDNADGAWGLQTERLRAAVRYWRDSYDWRAHETRMNELPHFRCEVDGVPLHFVHVRGEREDATPIVLSHGWPGSFWDFADVIPRLAFPSRYGGQAGNACHVVVPSLPGYDFAAPIVTSGVSYLRTAELWVRLMVNVLGYNRFAAHGYDWGGSVTAQLGHRFAAQVLAVHLASPLTLGSWSAERPHAEILGRLMDDARGDQRAALLAWERRRASHLAVHLLEPQTLAHALHDSPAALLAWLYQRRLTLSDPGIADNRASDPDDVLTLAMLSWVTDTAGSSIRYYREAAQDTWAPAHDRRPLVEPPAGLSLFRPDLPPGFEMTRLAGYYNLVYIAEHPQGGHYPSLEVPHLLAADIQNTLRAARSLS